MKLGHFYNDKVKLHETWTYSSDFLFLFVIKLSISFFPYSSREKLRAIECEVLSVELKLLKRKI